jgi:hypothetical protein
LLISSKYLSDIVQWMRRTGYFLSEGSKYEISNTSIKKG